MTCGIGIVEFNVPLDTEALARQGAKPSKIKAQYS